MFKVRKIEYTLLMKIKDSRREILFLFLLVLPWIDFVKGRKRKVKAESVEDGAWLATRSSVDWGALFVQPRNTRFPRLKKIQLFCKIVEFCYLSFWLFEFVDVVYMVFKTEKCNFWFKGLEHWKFFELQTLNLVFFFFF